MMVHRLARTFGLSLPLVLAMSVALTAARDYAPALTFIEARRPTAEAGVRQIKAKAPDSLQELQRGYAAAVAANNAWLDATVAGIREGTPSPTAADDAAKAASTFIEWAARRTAAFGETPMQGTVRAISETSTRESLLTISTDAVKRNRDPQKRAAAADDSRRA